jgi:hypothetical protein
VKRDAPITKELIKNHIEGEITIGAYPVNPEDNSTKWLCFDVDNDHNENPQEVTRSIIDCIKDKDKEIISAMMLEKSSQDSYHLWIFFSNNPPARELKRVGEGIRRELGKNATEIEVFPKQDEVSKNDYGNAVRLPFGYHQSKDVWSKRLDLTTFTENSMSLNDIQPIKYIYQKTGKTDLTRKTDVSVEDKIDLLRPCFKTMFENTNVNALDEDGDLQHQARMALVAEAQYHHFSLDEIIKLFENQPDYDEKQTRDQIKSLVDKNIEKGVKRSKYSCQTIIEKYGWCNAEDPEVCYLQQQEKPVEKPDTPIPQLLGEKFKVEYGNSGYVLLEKINRKYEPRKTFKSLGSGTARDISNTLSIELELVERQLAALSIHRKNQETTEEEVEEQETQKNVKPIPRLHTDKFLAEQVWDGKTPPKYIVKYFNKSGFEYVSEISLGEIDDQGRTIVYTPVYSDHLTKGMVIVPQEPVECTLKEAIEDIFRFVSNPRYYDPCGKQAEVKTLALITLGSWFIDRMEPDTVIPVAGVGRFAPIIPIRGPSESGKNRLANLLRFISYHPYFDLSKTAIPSLFRPLDVWRGTLIMDETDVKNSGATSQLIQFLNSRAYGTPISRQNPEKVSESNVFQSFGITIVTQRQHFDDNATESHSIPYYSEKTTKKLPTVEENTIVEEGLKIQNKLLYLRLTLWPKIEIIKSKWHKDLTDHRLNSALLVVFALAEHEPWINDIIDETVKPIERAKRRRKATSIDGQIINYVWDKLDNKLFEIHEGRYFILERNKVYIDDQGKEKIDKKPLIATNIKEHLGLGYKTIRKVWDSVNVTPDDVPDRIRVGDRTHRVFWFKPDRLEKMLREFVLDYDPYSLYDRLGIERPEEPDESVTGLTDVTGSGEGGTPSESDTPYEKELEDTTETETPPPPDLSQTSHLSQNYPKALADKLTEALKAISAGIKTPEQLAEKMEVHVKGASDFIAVLEQEGMIWTPDGKVDWRLK